MLELPWEEGSLVGRGAGRVDEPLAEGVSGAPPPTGWHARPLASLDLETTGRDPHHDRIVGIALYLQQAGAPPRAVVNTLTDPGPDVLIPDEAAAVHGITRERLTKTGAPPLAQVLGTVHQILVERVASGAGLVIYNAPFDWPFLAAELARLSPPRWLPDCRLVDPLVLDRHVDPYRRGKRTLQAACEEYGVTLEQAHDAGADALAALEVARAIGDRYPTVAALSLRELVDLQIQAHTRWRKDFNAYLQRIGADRDPVVTTWPGSRPAAGMDQAAQPMADPEGGSSIVTVPEVGSVDDRVSSPSNRASSLAGRVSASAR